MPPMWIRKNKMTKEILNETAKKIIIDINELYDAEDGKPMISIHDNEDVIHINCSTNIIIDIGNRP